MKNRKTRLWIIGLTIATLLICGVFIGLGIWAGSRFDNGSDGLAFGDAIAIVRVEGTILSGEAPAPSPFGTTVGAAYSGTIIDHLKQANEDSDVKSVILYVDSPGGSVFASDEIALQIQQMDKPIIASMASLAASGGYYVSAPTDEIWASAHTLTCSIGVISQFPNFEGFAEEYGITFITLKSGQFKDLGNPFREFTEEDRALWQAIIDEAYSGFVEIVANGRDMSEAEVREIADGRVCTGKQAQATGLVDNLGYLPDAIDRAAELGGIEDEDPRIIEYNTTPSFLETLSAGFKQPSPVDELQQMMHYHPGSPVMYLYLGVEPRDRQEDQEEGGEGHQPEEQNGPGDRLQPAGDAGELAATLRGLRVSRGRRGLGHRAAPEGVTAPAKRRVSTKGRAAAAEGVTAPATEGIAAATEGCVASEGGPAAGDPLG
ncbi:MAG: signal peptide peptidase SppA, partial [Chloroflexota bacterium]